MFSGKINTLLVNSWFFRDIVSVEKLWCTVLIEM